MPDQKVLRLEISGDKFTPDSVILFNGSQLPTTYIGPQRSVRANFRRFDHFPGSKKYDGHYARRKIFQSRSRSTFRNRRNRSFKYIGMIARKRYNNDTAYFEEPGKEEPIGARLNDIVAGRFRLKSISAEEVIFEDVSLGFKHKLALNRADVRGKLLLPLSGKSAR